MDSLVKSDALQETWASRVVPPLHHKAHDLLPPKLQRCSRNDNAKKKKKERKEEREEDAVEYPNRNVKEGGREILQIV